ncbi:hypothetical protein LB553_01020 [Mesorhizobium sp. CA8]|uniref:hypothetical protein n=1 Tax=Mesorhizobium sp. CA8 TaxID=2876637 RepID=UPI001CCCC4BB|nr:hypothetical protein [Mesorhizobium sp. CA8]MBZ9759469.1 hypothetical protein [Mesorhizobium sp. CA8]
MSEKRPADFCPYCNKHVGYVGRALAWFFGTRIHGCDFSNTDSPKPWLIDREGIVYKPERRVVLKAKDSA